MKLPSRYALPPLDRRSGLPLLLAGLLSAVLAFQLLATDAPDLPPVGPIGRGAVRSARLPGVDPASGTGAVVARALFSPAAAPAPATMTGDAGAGVTIAGSIRVGRSMVAVVQGPGDRIANVPVGGRIGGWRLHSIGASEAQLVRAGEKMIVPFGARTILPANAAAAGSQ